MASQDLSWHLEKTSNFSQTSFIVASTAKLQDQRQDLLRKPEIGWQNTSKGEVGIGGLEGLINLYTGPIRPFDPNESGGLHDASELPSLGANSPRRLQLVDGYRSTHESGGDEHSAESQQTSQSAQTVVDSSVVLNLPRQPTTPLEPEAIGPSLTPHTNTPVVTAVDLPTEPLANNVDHELADCPLRRQLSANIVPSSQEGEKDSGPSSASRATTVCYRTGRDDEETVPETPDTSLVAIRRTSALSVRSSSGWSPVGLGMTHTYSNVRGRPEALPVSKCSGVQQRPLYP